MVDQSAPLKVMVNDPIADMLTRIRNALARRHRQVPIPFSKVRVAIAEVLKATHYIRDFELLAGERFRRLVLRLGYVKGQPLIRGLKRVSKTGLRVYAQCQHLPQALNGMGIVIMSTCHGIMTARTARQHKVGGEVLAFVW